MQDDTSNGFSFTESFAKPDQALGYDLTQQLY